MSNNGAGSVDELFLFVHMPKTGGQSLHSFFNTHLVPNQSYVHLVSPATLNAHLGMLTSDFTRRPLEERVKAKVILGHKVDRNTHKLVPGKTARHIVFLREPAETLVSYYNFQMAGRHKRNEPLIPFEEWYDESKQRNMMTRWLLTEFMKEPHPRRTAWPQVQQMLCSFWFVGCTEYLDRDAPLLFERIGVHGVLERANVSGLHHEETLTLDAGLRERLRAENPIDVELYEYWKGRLAQTVARIRAEIQDRTKATPRSLTNEKQHRVSV